MKAFSITQPLPPGITLIEASAGTGKTWTITGLVLRLLVEEQLELPQILVVTFTEAATSELQDRVRKRLREAIGHLDGSLPVQGDPLLDHLSEVSQDDLTGALLRLRTALADFDLAAISTIHGFCRRMLQENAFESGVLFDTELVGDQTALLEEIVYDFWARDLEQAHPALVRYLAMQGVSPSSLLGIAEQVASRPDLPVLPSDPSQLPPPDDLGLMQAFDTFKAAWGEHRRSLHEALYGRIRGWDYSGEALSDLFRQVDGFLAPDRYEGAPPWALDRLRRDELGSRTWRDEELPANPLLDAIEDFYDAWFQHQGALNQHLLRLELDLVDFVRRELPKRKAKANTWSFDDLLLQLDQALQKPGVGPRLAHSIRLRHRAALIDEFQDTDPVQYRIFQTVFGHQGDWLFLIGDPKQAIYGFRGADIFAYRRAKADAGDRAYTLRVNYRSDPGLVAAMNQLFTRLVLPFAYDFIDYPEVSARPGASDQLDQGAPLQLRFLDSPWLKKPWQGRISKTGPTGWEAAIPRQVAADIRDLLRGGEKLGDRLVRPGDIAVLVRKNQQAIQVQEALRAVGVPSVLHGATSVLASDEADQLELLLAGIAEPGRRSALRTALSTPLIGLDGHALAQLDSDEEGAWDDWIDRFRRWRGLWERQSVARMFRAVLEDQGLQVRLLGLPDGERRMTNLLHLVELVHTAAVSQELGVTGVLRWLRSTRMDQTPDPEAMSLRLESDARAVQLVTVHGSKGLEYPIVYCPYLWHSWVKTASSSPQVRFHDPDDEHGLKLDLGGPRHGAHLDLMNLEDRAEDLRLLYVAITRARHRALLYLGPFRPLDHSALGYLLHQPTGVLPEHKPLDATAAHVKQLTGRQLRGEIEALAAESQGRISASLADQPTHARWSPETEQHPLLQARRPAAQPDRSWHTSSFSRLTRTSERGLKLAAGPVAEGRDRDIAVVEPEPSPETGRPIRLLEFPRGAKAGNFFHDVLEHLDFQATDPLELDEHVRRMLRVHGFDEELSPTVCDALGAVLATPFHTDGLCLRDLAPAQRINELEFTVPVGSGLRARTDTPRLDRPAIARVFRDHGSAQIPVDYPDSLERLEFEPLHGFLMGFVDLIFQHEGRWYVVDYKTNHLGDHLDAYAQARLPEAMAHGHYFLQYTLYVLALHRYLKLRLPDYDYEQHFGGATYLFLKGMEPSLGADHGAFRDRPSLTMIEALEAALEGA